MQSSIGAALTIEGDSGKEFLAEPEAIFAPFGSATTFCQQAPADTRQAGDPGSATFLFLSGRALQLSACFFKGEMIEWEDLVRTKIGPQLPPAPLEAKASFETY